MAWASAPRRRGDPFQIVQSMIHTTDRITEKANKVLENKQKPKSNTDNPASASTPTTLTPQRQAQTNTPQQPANTNTPTSPTTTHPSITPTTTSSYQTLLSKLQTQKVKLPPTVGPAPPPTDTTTSQSLTPQQTSKPTVQLQPRTERRQVYLAPNAQSSAASTDPQMDTAPSQDDTTTPSAPSTLTIQLFDALQNKATQHTHTQTHTHTQETDDINTQTVGPAVHHWQMVEQVPSSQQDKEQYERNKREFKSWKGVVRYPAPPQQLWDQTQADLAEMCTRHDKTERSITPAVWTSVCISQRYLQQWQPKCQNRLKESSFTYQTSKQYGWNSVGQSDPPVVATAWHFSYQFFRGTETGSLWMPTSHNVYWKRGSSPNSVSDEGPCAHEAGQEMVSQIRLGTSHMFSHSSFERIKPYGCRCSRQQIVISIHARKVKSWKLR